MLLLLFFCLSTGGDSLPLNAPHSDQGGVPLNETGQTTSPFSGVSLLHLSNESSETLNEFQEGDILVSEDRNAVSSIWDGGVVPYTVSDELVDREPVILAALKMITDPTCIRFVKRTTEEDYIEFIKGTGCASFVGKLGGVQQVYCGDTCDVGNLCHELMHSLGLYHEHTRFDRDQYVHVNWKNIQQGKENNFQIQRGNTLNLPYDINSIMHYGRFFFSKNKRTTIDPLNDVPSKMGQRSELTDLDKQKLNRLYDCSASFPFDPLDGLYLPRSQSSLKRS